MLALYKLSVLTSNDHTKRHKTIHFDFIQNEEKNNHISVVWPTGKRLACVAVINLTSLECFQELPHQNFIAQMHAIGGHSICVAVAVAVFLHFLID